MEACYAQVKVHVSCEQAISALAADWRAAQDARQSLPPQDVPGVDPADAVSRIADLVRAMQGHTVAKKLFGGSTPQSIQPVTPGGACTAVATRARPPIGELNAITGRKSQPSVQVKPAAANGVT